VRRGQRGFTLLEIMIALAVLAVGAMCVLSTFAAALALQMRREADVRAARVVAEAVDVAQSEWNRFTPARNTPFPEAIPETTYSRDPSVTFTVSFQPAEGLPQVGAGVQGGVWAVVTVVDGADSETGEGGRVRQERVFLSKNGFAEKELTTSKSFEQEKKDETKEKYDPYKGR
jgi:prepilin-type N-terminal cleavage/methylation domain-containing protein